MGPCPLVPTVPHLLSGSCSSPHTFVPRGLQTPPHGGALALPWSFGSPHPWTGDSHPQALRHAGDTRPGMSRALRRVGSMPMMLIEAPSSAYPRGMLRLGKSTFHRVLWWRVPPRSARLPRSGSGEGGTHPWWGRSRPPAATPHGPAGGARRGEGTRVSRCASPVRHACGRPAGWWHPGLAPPARAMAWGAWAPGVRGRGGAARTAEPPACCSCHQRRTRAPGAPPAR